MDRVQAAIAKAVRLDAEARQDKTNAEFYRRRAAKKRAELRDFVEQCTRRGIEVEITGPSTDFPEVSTPTSEGDASGDQAEVEAAVQ